MLAGNWVVEMNNIDHQMNLLENSETSNLPPVATRMLTLMVRGILTNCSLPYAHFPTDCLTSAIVICVVRLFYCSTL